MDEKKEFARIKALESDSAPMTCPADPKGRGSCFVARLESEQYGVPVRSQGKPARGNGTWLEGVGDASVNAATQRVLEAA